MLIIAKSLEDTKRFAGDVIKFVEGLKSNKATVLDLEGNLGAGKTTLVQMIGETLGVKEVMQSPTFVLMKVYKIKSPRFKKLVHIDAYRIEHVDEAKILNLEEIFGDKDNLVCVEWAEKIRAKVPSDAIKVSCKLLQGDRHRYELESSGRKCSC